MIMAYRTVAIYHGIKKIYIIIKGHSQPQSLMVQLKGLRKSYPVESFPLLEPNAPFIYSLGRVKVFLRFLS